jgi:NAD(P)-dependent dehydrogenase (short-subunit alcohol dehydrogenase family)
MRIAAASIASGKRDFAGTRPSAGRTRRRLEHGLGAATRQGSQNMGETPDESRPMRGKTCVITGATSGLGRATARKLASQGANVVLTGRSAAGEAVAAGIRHEFGAPAEFIRADISSLADVRALAARISTAYPKLDVLVNNAGARIDRYGASADGIELTFATNHLGHFLLTGLLLENLKRSGAGRVVTVASIAHHGVAPGPVEWLPSPDRYDRRQAYARSKLANILFAFELARRLRDTPVMSNAVDPGIIATRFARNNGLVAWAKHVVSHLAKGEIVSAEAASGAVVYPAVAPEAAKLTGKLFRGRQMVEPSAHAQNRDLAQELWALSVRLSDVSGHFCQQV